MPKISVVKYLNAVPLAWGILEGPQKADFEPILSTPAECADQLAKGSVDVGLIPSIEYQRIKGSRIVPGPAVASIYQVRSVILVSMVPLWKVKTVACDNGSRTRHHLDPTPPLPAPARTRAERPHTHSLPAERSAYEEGASRCSALLSSSCFHNPTRATPQHITHSPDTDRNDLSSHTLTHTDQTCAWIAHSPPSRKLPEAVAAFRPLSLSHTNRLVCTHTHSQTPIIE
jgi:hypothetical protein